MSPVELETRSSKLETNHKELAQDIVRRAMNLGAAAAECVIREGDEFSTLVRLGQVETLKESGSKAIGVRVFNGKRAASTYSSDFSREGLDRMLKSALELSRITSEDPYAGIPEPEQISICTTQMFIPFLARSASAMRGEPRKPRSITIRESRTQKVVRLMPLLVIKCWPIRTVSLVNTGARTARLRQFPLRKMKAAPCSAITGTRSRAA